jgi:hypothetical protein
MVDRKLKRRDILDPAVADLLAGMEEKQAESQLPRRQREKKARERAKIQARKPQRVTYDLPPALRAQVHDLAEEQRLPASQLVTLALARFLKDLNSGAVDLGSLKQPSHSPRYDWNLVFPPGVLPDPPKRHHS